MADVSSNPAAGYYSGRPLSVQHDPQQAQAPPAPPPEAQPQAAAGEQVNGLPAPQPQPQPQPRQDVGEQVANYTHVHGVPGYYNGRVNNTNTAAAPLSAPAPVASPPAPAPTTAIEPEINLSWIDKCRMCFTGSSNTR